MPPDADWQYGAVEGDLDSSRLARAAVEQRMRRHRTPGSDCGAILPHCPYPWRDWAGGGMMGRRSGAAMRGAYQARADRTSRCALGQCHRQHEVGNSRCYFGAKPRAVENAVVPDTRLQPMRLAIRRDVDAQAVCRFGLPDARNVIVFAFDG